MITEADRHHKDTSSKIGTSIQLSNNIQSRGEQPKRPNKAKRKSLFMQNQRMQQKHQEWKQHGSVSGPKTKPALAKENCLHRKNKQQKKIKSQDSR